jgi:hypothetical protein
MIQKLGIKRAIILFGLLLLLAALAAANYLYFMPQGEKDLTDLNAVKTQLSQLQSELDKMRSDFVMFEQQKVFFEKMQKMGFFNVQDRVIARERFDTMQKLSKILSAKYQVKAARLYQDKDADRVGFVVMESPVTVNLSAIDDLDVYRFIYYLNYSFPGHIGIDNLMIERKQNVNQEILKQIGTGAPPEIISATIDLNWRTMARKSEIAPDSVETAAQPQAAQEGQGVTQ